MKQTNSSYNDYLTKSTCPICSKEFMHYSDWYWKIGNYGFETRDQYVCSYSCMRAWEKDQEARELAKRDKE